MKKCQFCAEEIQDAAIKCKHCGSILNNASPIPSSTDYREVKKGIKQVEADKIEYNINVFFSILGGVIVGWIAGSVSGSFWGWAFGLGTFFLIGIKSANKYFEFDKKQNR